MSLPIYQRVAVTDSGDVIPGAEYTVINENTGVAAPIYSDRTGATLLTAPYFADSVGTIQFYIAQGTTFRVAASGGVGTYTDRYVYGVAGAVLTDASGSVDDGGADPLTISRNGGTDSNTSIRFKQLSSSWYAGTSGSNNFGIGTTADIGVAPVQITAAGNVGIGGASFLAKLNSNADNQGDLYFSGSTQNTRPLIFSTFATASPSAGHKIDASSSNGVIAFATGSSERMRIDNAGNFMVNKTSTGFVNNGAFSFSSGVSSYSGVMVINHSTSNVSGSGFINFARNTAYIGSISQSGTSSVSYNTSSDYRLKEDDVPMTGATERVKALRPINFAWKVDGSRVDGFFAHELAEVVPEAATGTKDAMMDEEYEITPAVYEDVATPAVEAVLDEDGMVITEAVEESTESVLVTEAVMGTRLVPDYQGIDQSKLVPLLTATIQELIARIEALEAGA